MHILWLPSWYPDSAEDIRGNFFREQALELKETGCRVGVISASLGSLRTLSKTLRDAGQMRVDNDGGLRTIRLSKPNWFPRLWPLNAEQYSRMIVKLFEEYISQYGMPDLVHLHAALPAGIGAVEIHNRYAIPYILTEHSSVFVRNLASRRELSTARAVAKLAQTRTAVSGALAEIMSEKLGSDLGPWEITPNPVSSYFFDGPKRTPSRGRFRFLHVSLLDENKNVSLILKAFAKAFEGNPTVDLVIGGHGPLKNKLIEEASLLGIASNVKFTGYLSRAEVRDQLSDADAFVLSSRHETFGVVLVEAMAMGCPVISTKCGGPQDIVRPETGILVPKDDIAAMTSAMRLLVNQRDHYQPAVIRTLCLERFGPATVAKQWLSKYENALLKERRT